MTKESPLRGANRAALVAALSFGAATAAYAGDGTGHLPMRQHEHVSVGGGFAGSTICGSAGARAGIIFGW